jgi:tRNA 2-thiouridine synthesizing protein A
VPGTASSTATRQRLRGVTGGAPVSNETTEQTATTILDTSGLACPMPIVRTRQAMDQLASGDRLQVISTDRGSLRDIPAWAESMGHTMLSVDDAGDRFTFLIQKG